VTVKNQKKKLIRKLWFWYIKFRGKILGISIFGKLLGIGLLLSIFFSLAIGIQLQRYLSKQLVDFQVQKVAETAGFLSQTLREYLRKKNVQAMDAKMQGLIHSFEDIQYIVVFGAQGKLLCHRVHPRYFLKLNKNAFSGNGKLFFFTKNEFTNLENIHRTGRKKYLEYHYEFIDKRREIVLNNGTAVYVQYQEGTEGTLFAASVSIEDGILGHLQLGLSGSSMHKQIRDIFIDFLLTLAVFMVLGIFIAYFFAHSFTVPVLSLRRAVRLLLQGDYNSRSKIHSKDEIGQLAIAFNQMAAGLQAYQQKLLEHGTELSYLVSKTVSIQEEERKAIARELHDELGPALSALLIKLRMLELIQNMDASEQLEEIRLGIKGIIDRVHTISWNMRPSILDDYGLDLALRRYISELSKLYQDSFFIDYQSNLEAKERIAPHVEISLYRIAQEAIQNAIRHSGGSSISVVLVRGKSELILLVEDNGHGFESERPANLRPDGGMGLISMRERALLIKGSFFVDSEAGRGSTVRVTIPTAFIPKEAN